MGEGITAYQALLAAAAQPKPPWWWPYAIERVAKDAARWVKDRDYEERTRRPHGQVECDQEQRS